MENNFKHMEWDDLIGRNVDHMWQNWLTDKAPYVCECGVEFDTYDELMTHTAELNPVVDTRSMGSAGAAIEYEAHKKTLARLQEAIGFLQEVVWGLPTNDWRDRAMAKFPELHDEPHKETGFGD